MACDYSHSLDRRAKGFIIKICLLALSLGLIVSACALAQEPPKTDRSDDAISFIFLRDYSFEQYTEPLIDDANIARCISDAIRKNKPDQRIVPFEEFQQLAFPNLPPNARPRKPEYISVLLKDPKFLNRISRLGLHYLLFVGGTERIKEQGWGAWGINMTGIGGVFNSWDNKTHISALLIDLKNVQSNKDFDTEKTSTSWFFSIWFVPLGKPNLTLLDACTDIGNQVGNHLTEMSSK